MRVSHACSSLPSRPGGTGARFCFWRLAVSLLVAGPLAILPPGGRAQLPTGAQVITGRVGFTQTADTLTITQGSKTAIVNWQTFGLGAGETLRLLQPGSEAALLARVTGGNPSSLQGTLRADGRLFLINPKGIVVGRDAVIDTAGFLGSTLDVSDDDFLRGAQLTFKGDSPAGIVNLGKIVAREGHVLLFAHAVRNSGEITAPRGTAGLAAGTEVHLASPDTGDFSIKLNLPAAAEGTGVDNSGLVAAAQARLEAAGGSIYDLAVNQSGVVRAQGVERRGGRVLLTAAGGTVGVSGEVTARRADGSGGEILIGGDFRGASADVANAAQTVVTPTARLDASAANPTAAAGRVAVWAEAATRFLGRIDATGQGGGFAEVSGRRFLDFNPAAPVNLGVGGHLLLDPDALVISAAGSGGTATSGTNPFVFSATTEPATLNVTTLQNQLALTHVTLDTSTSAGDITVNSAVNWSTNHTLRLQAGGSINLNASLTGGSASTLALFPGRNASPTDPRSQTLLPLNNRATLSAGSTITVGTLTYGANAAAAIPGYTTKSPAETGPGTFDGNLNVGTLEVDLSGGAAGVTTNGANNAIGAFRTTGTGNLNSATVIDHQGGLDVRIDTTSSASPLLTFQTPGTLTLLSGTRLAFTSAATVALASTGGAFVNQAGASAFGTNARYLIYTSRAAATTRGGLTPTYVFNQAYDSGNALGSFGGDTTSRLIYSGARPTLTLTANNQTRAYGDANPTLTATASGLVDGDTLGTATTGSVAVSTTATAQSNVGSFPITAATGSLASSFYALAFAPGTLSVTPAPLAITVDAQSRAYGDANPAFTATFSGLKNSDTAAAVGTLALTTSATAASGAATYPISGTLTNASANYTPTITAGTLTVNRAPLTVSVSSGITKNQGDANPNFLNFTTATGLKLADTLAAAVPDLAFTTTATTSSPAGSYPVAASGTSGNYRPTFNPGQLTVAAVALPILTYAASNLSRVYGAANPALTFTRSALTPGVADDVTGAPALSTTATQSSGVGAYAISIARGSLASANYQFSFVPGTLTLTAAPLTVTVANASRLYGDANPVFATQVTGLQNSDSAAAAGTFTASTTATVASQVGNYTVGGTLAGTSGNYTATVVPGTLTINPAPLTATIANAARAPNTANPAFSATYAGFKNGDTAAVISGLAFTTTATAASGAGAYPINGSGTATNYTLTFVPGSLTIGGVLSYVAANATRTYGAVNPTLGYAVSGLLAGDTLAGVVSGAPALSTVATQSSGVGAYAITIAQGTLSSPTYGFTFTPGTLSITAAPLTIAANSASRTYGAANPALTATYTGLVNGDTAGSAVSGLLLSTSAAATSGVGTYPITPSGATAPNYAITYQPGSLAVNPAPLAVTVNDATRVYGDPNPAFTGAVSGLVNGESAATAGLGYQTSATVASNATTAPASFYPITATLAGGNGNYVLQSVTPGRLTVTPAPLVVAIDDQTRRYGDPDPLFTYRVSGLKNGEIAASVLTVGALATNAAATAGIGAYGIFGAASATTPNYQVTTRAGSLTVTPRPLTITADAKTREYGEENPVLTATYSGLAPFDTPATLGALSLRTLATPASGVGTFGITFTPPDHRNYAITSNFGRLTITPAPLTLLPLLELSRVYGRADPTPALPTLGGLKLADTAAGLGLRYEFPAATADAGSYTYRLSTTNPNYALPPATGLFKVEPAPLAVAITPTGRLYGDPNPANYTFTASGLAFADTAAAVVRIQNPTETGTDAGTYSLGPQLISRNYTLGPVTGGTFTISPRVLTLDLPYYARYYGDLNPSFNLADVVVGGDRVAPFDTIASLLTGLRTAAAVNAQSATGYYRIDPIFANNPNYRYAWTPGYLAVVPRPIEITVRNGVSFGNNHVPAEFDAAALGVDLIRFGAGAPAGGSGYSFSATNLPAFASVASLAAGVQYELTDLNTPQAVGVATPLGSVPFPGRPARTAPVAAADPLPSTLPVQTTTFTTVTATLPTFSVVPTISDTRIVYTGGGFLLDPSGTTEDTRFLDTIRYIQPKLSLGGNYVVTKITAGKLTMKADPEVVAATRAAEELAARRKAAELAFQRGPELLAPATFGLERSEYSLIREAFVNLLNDMVKAPGYDAFLVNWLGFQPKSLGEISNDQILFWLADIHTNPLKQAMLRPAMVNYALAVTAVPAASRSPAQAALVAKMTPFIGAARDQFLDTVQVEMAGWQGASLKGSLADAYGIVRTPYEEIISRGVEATFGRSSDALQAQMAKVNETEAARLLGLGAGMSAGAAAGIVMSQVVIGSMGSIFPGLSTTITMAVDKATELTLTAAAGTLKGMSGPVAGAALVVSLAVTAAITKGTSAAKENDARMAYESLMATRGTAVDPARMNDTAQDRAIVTLGLMKMFGG